MLGKLFRSRTTARPGEALYALAVEQARNPVFYTRLGVEDRIDARFELYTLHVLLLVMRLKEEGGSWSDQAQELFDTYVSALDHVLRELGVGDVAVGKKMRKLGEAMYGRMNAYEVALRAGNENELAASLARNVHDSEDAERARPLARYAMNTRAGLTAQPIVSAVRKPDWAEIVA